MIRIVDPSHCCGCSACVQRCPKQCISLREDAEGFLYPEVDTSLCVDCGLCEQVCPELHPDAERQPLQTFAAVNPDAEVRRTSSSGGVFTALAEQVIDAGGVVFGAAFDEHWEVRHRCATTREELAAFRGSKYVQSVIGDTFLQAERFLKSGRRVLFSGTPCQIAGLRRFLRRDYDHLLCVDFVCHGVPSPGVFRAYLAEEMTKIARKGEKKYSFAFSTIPSIPKADALAARLGCRIEDIRFRDKTNGWKKYSFALSLSKASAAGEKIQFCALGDDKKTNWHNWRCTSLLAKLHLFCCFGSSNQSCSPLHSFSENPKHLKNLSPNSTDLVFLSSLCFTENAFMQAFLRDLILRPSCYACPAKCFRSGSDLTLGDYWGVEREAPHLDDDGGTSVVFVNSGRGQQFLSSLPFVLHPQPFGRVHAHNPSITVSVNRPINRKFFFMMLRRSGFFRALGATTNPSLPFRLWRKLYRMI